MRSRVRRYAPSYLTYHGRGFYPETQAQFLRLLWDVSAPLADDKISNEKYLLFDLIFFTKIFHKNENCCSEKKLMCIFSSEDCKTLFAS